MINLYTNSTIGSYTTGTVTCTNNSDIVTGTGTTWSEIVNPGDILTLNDDKLYVIKTVNSNTSITLDKVFAENTVSNSAYRIFLNTAAHFPSDTAAKVERALEQLSDINEAAINNNRTVTAATKVNGKGLTNTTGDINIYPNSVNANNGGRIQFHYNQGSTETAKIWENASGQVRIDGNLYHNGAFTKSRIQIQPSTTVLRGVIPSSTISGEVFNLCTSDGIEWSNVLGYLSSTVNTNNIVTTSIGVRSNTSSLTTATISVNVDGNNNVYTSAPTPETTDNSTQIATTAFVNNRLPYTTGTWTPTLSGSTTAGSFTYSYTGGGRECYYVKFGNLVFLRAIFSYTITSEPAGEVRINGAPFVSISYYDGTGGGNTRRWHLSQTGLNSTFIRPEVYKSDLSGVNIPRWGSSDSLTTWLNTVDSYDWIIFSIWYKTNS